MKRLLFFLVFTQTALCSEAKVLKALFDFKTFYAPGQGSYVETYLSINGRSVHYKQNERGNFEASVEVMVTFKEGTVLKHTDKYNLVGPALKDTLQPLDFIDYKRLQLPNGNYIMELSIRDNNSGGKTFTISQPVVTNYPADHIAISGITLVNSFSKSERPDNILSKNGYEIIPRVDNFYPSSFDKLIFYAEIYNTKKIIGDSGLLVKYYFRNIESGKMLDNYGSAQRKSANEVIPVLSEISIKDLPSGNYELVLEARDKNNNLQASGNVAIQRSSPITNSLVNTYTQNTFVEAYTDVSVLRENIASLQPISNALQSEFINNQLKASDLQMMKNFFLDFWQKKDPLEPEKAWLVYKANVDAVQKKFGTTAIKGYNTDMGRVFLAYGPPSTITKSDFEPNTYPYEMWRYNKVKNHSNKMFVFYNPDLLARNYTLLHSDMPGEVYESAWNLKLHKMLAPNSIDDTGNDIKNTYSGDKTENNSKTK